MIKVAFNPKCVLQNPLLSPYPAVRTSCALNGTGYIKVLCQVFTNIISSGLYHTRLSP